MSSGAREKSSGTAAMPEGGGMVPERPDTEVTAKPARRRFTAAYKLSVVERAEGCKEPGEVGRLLRQEGLYSSQLSAWRKAAREGSLQELGKKRGPRKRPPVTKRWKERARELERENRRLREDLRRAHLVVEVQEKMAELLGVGLADEEGA